MIKWVVQSFILVFLIGCQSLSLKNISRKSGEDVLEKESMLRFTKKRLKKISHSNKNQLKSLALCYQGEISQGLKSLNKNYAKNKNKPSYWNHIGTCYFLNDNISKARMFFQKSHFLAKKQFSPALNNLGLLYLKEKQFEASLRYFQQAIKVAPSSLTPQFNLGHLYLQLGQSKKAEDIFKKLYRINQKDIDVISALGSIALTKGKIKESLAYFKKVSGKDLRRPDISLNYAMALTQANEKVKAKKVLANIENHKDWASYRQSLEKVLD